MCFLIFIKVFSLLRLILRSLDVRVVEIVCGFFRLIDIGDMKCFNDLEVRLLCECL